MQIYFIILFFILGTVFGSFYNVVGFRLCNNQSIIKPRSHCPKCKHQLSSLELIPIISYIFLGGKCKNCKQKISIFYPLIELFTGILFAVSFYSFSFTPDLLLALILSSMFSIILVTDLNYYIIPDEVNIASCILVFIINIIKFNFLTALKYLGYGFIMFLSMYLLMLIGNKLFKEETLGGGDIKLIFVLGMTLPLALSFTGIFLAALIALPVSIYILIKNKDKAIPFGPFLVGSFLILFLLKIDVADIIKILS